MKYCTRCGNELADDMMFCQKCGTKSIDVAENTYQQEDLYDDYWGLTFTDIYKKTIELTPRGVHIYRNKGIMAPKFDKTIPYSEIIDIHSKRAGLAAGYISLLTATEGIQIDFTIATPDQCMMLQNDENTLAFQKKDEAIVERINRALKEICHNPPTTEVKYTYYDEENKTKTYSPSLSNPAKPKSKSAVGCLVAVIIVILFIIIGVSVSNNGDSTSSTNNTNTAEKVKSGEDYESAVFDAFWEGASKSFGVEYSDYKWTHTATSYISDFETKEGYVVHYYLIETAFETKNAFGQEILHPVTARCYYVPEHSNTVYTTYMTLDGETILFNEEQEDWLMGMGAVSTSESSNQTTTNAQDFSENEKSISADAVTDNSSYENTSSVEKNDIENLKYVVNGVCNNYNSGNTPYNGKLVATVDNSTTITITHNIPDSLPFSEEEKVNQMENVIKNVFAELNNEFPEPITIKVKTSVAYTSSKIE